MLYVVVVLFDMYIVTRKLEHESNTGTAILGTVRVVFDHLTTLSPKPS